MATTVNISSYSASVSAGDWTPAFMAALADIQATGGTIHIDTDVVIKSMADFTQTSNYINLNFTSDLGATVTIQTGASNIAFNFANVNVVRFSGIVFLGNTGTGGAADTLALFTTGFMHLLIIEDCAFYGIAAAVGLINITTGTNGVVRNVLFGGCGGYHVRVVGGIGAVIDNMEAYDWGNFRTTYYDRQYSRPAWIVADTPPASASAQAPFIQITGFRGDEGAGKQIDITDYPRVSVEHCANNISTTGSGYNFTTTPNVSVKQSFLGYNGNSTDSIVLTNCGYVSIDGIEIQNGIHPISIDAGTTYTTIVNSPTLTVNPASGASYSLNGNRKKG